MSPSPKAKGKVLLTGGTGFIASHVLDCLLDHGFEVVVTARSHEKGQRIVKSIDGNTSGKRVSYVVVEDIAKDGAFDDAVKSDPPLDYVVHHTASPYQLHWDDPVKDCLEPAINGTTGILKSIKIHAPSVKRVVITSSSAAILSPPDHRAVYDESCWSDVSWEQAKDVKHTYRASKVGKPSFITTPEILPREPLRRFGTLHINTHPSLSLSRQKFAEQAAWSFIQTEKPNFTLAAINNTYTFGPIPRSLGSLQTLNTSNHRIRDLALGGMRSGIQPTAPVFTFVDVRDVALAHVRAMTVPAAGGRRFYVVGGFFSNPRLAEIVRRRFPALKGRLPAAVEGEGFRDDFPEDHWLFDNTLSKKMLAIEYTGLEESVVDTVESILKFEGGQSGRGD
ncbi:methylglyoxal reductase (NADPH-dependent) gre2 [Collariella sp. IMI 366227]|nr:methylglyoxal reductase (NADPH-dependent) gre2 [Collariella sp. IMI 366227]